ncbi:MAG TPA: polymer-forming cytoskeletal protein [Candidatus Cybelea sp.]|nr:polymer-forming cytoskeletal protein [Candidatus Cybelea sp.]
MFGRKKTSSDQDRPAVINSPPVEDDIPPMPAALQPTALKPALRMTTPQGTSMSSTDSSMPTPYRPDISRRTADIPGSPRPVSTSPARMDAPSPKTLIVGREISLQGEITSCDRLVVEGKVEAALSDCQTIEIAESGLVKGAAEVQEADIRGRFEGKLTVRGRLLIRSAGKVAGDIRYGQLEIECGGQITGQIESTGAERIGLQPRVATGLLAGE